MRRTLFVPGSGTGLTPGSSRAPVRKTADQNIPGATLVDVTGLAVPIAANEKLVVAGLVLFDTTTTNDLQLTVTVPAGATGVWAGIGPSTTNVVGAATGIFSAKAFGIINGYGGGRAAGAARNAQSVLVRLTVLNSTTAGTVQVQAAKLVNTDATTPADDAVIYANSYLSATVTA